jgi:hypothetical protein
MTAQMERVDKAFDQVFDSFRKATESTLQMQQDLWRQWTAAWPAFPKSLPPWTQQVQRFEEQWVNGMTELMKKYQQTWEAQYKSSIASFEEAFRLAEAKDPVEFRKQVMGLWQKSFENLKEFAQAQTGNFQAAIEKWLGMVKKTAPATN